MDWEKSEIVLPPEAEKPVKIDVTNKELSETVCQHLEPTPSTSKSTDIDSLSESFREVDIDEAIRQHRNTARVSVSKESSVDCDDEQSISREDNQMYLDNCGFGVGSGANAFNAHDELTQEREEIEKAVRNKEITPGRAKLQLWLYRSMRIVMTDGRILIGIFLCTDSDANVILGVCSEFTKNCTDERMLGLVMVPGRHIVSMHLDTRCTANPFQTAT